MVEPTDYELGEDVTDLVERPTRPASLVVSARLERDDAERLLAMARKTNRTLSQIAREALRQYIADSDRGQPLPAPTWSEAGVMLAPSATSRTAGSEAAWKPTPGGSSA